MRPIIKESTSKESAKSFRRPISADTSAGILQNYPTAFEPEKPKEQTMKAKKPKNTVATDEVAGPKVMRVKKRNGDLEPVNVNKIINVVLACASNLKEVDPMRVATKVISGLYDGATTKELDKLCIRTASLLIAEDPNYSKLAGRLMIRYIHEEVQNQNIQNFFDSIKAGYKCGTYFKKRAPFC